MNVLDVFSREEVERARRYHRPLYAALFLDLLFGGAVLAVFAVWLAGDRVAAWTDGLGWAAEAALLAAATIGASELVRLPLSFWRGLHYERRWGLSTQSFGGWLADRAKGLGIGIALTAPALVGLVGLARWIPRWWVVPAAGAAALLVLVLGFVAPVLLEPVFNRFEPLRDTQLADDLRALARRAATPVRDVLVADASRRTKKVNAYVSGFGATRRVVLYDTLLERTAPREVKLVIAHELGHRRERHVVKGTLIGMGGAASGVAAIWALLHWAAILGWIGASGPGDPRVVPFVLLAAFALELLALPLETGLSRRWERDADRFSLELTEDLDAFEAAHRELARTNLADLDPPRALYLLLFTHPTSPERIAAARRWAEARAA